MTANSLPAFFKSLPSSKKEYHRKLRRDFNVPANLSGFQNVILFGAAQLGKHFLHTFRKKGITVLAFSDNDKNKWGASIEGVPVIPPGAINKQQYSYVIVTSQYVKEICLQLRGLKVRNVISHCVVKVLFPDIAMHDFYPKCFTQIQGGKAGITKAYNLLSDVKSKRLFLRLLDYMVTLDIEKLPNPEPDEYFIRSFALSKNETYVDCGAYDGDTLREFLRRTRGRFSKYIALEPDKVNFSKLKRAIPRRSKKIFAVRAAATSKDGYVYFQPAPNRVGSAVSPKGRERVKAITIDKLCANQKVTSMKMDVEGHESLVLRGAVNTIKNHKPKLVVCAYHKPAHLWELILQIHRISPAYQKFYLRHHFSEITSTVLYVK